MSPMAGYLFVVPPLTGHVNPAVSVAAELRRRGHRVTWVAHTGIVGHLLEPDAAVIDAGSQFLAGAADVLAGRERLRGVGALRFLWQDVLVPLAREMTPRVVDAIAWARPDVVVADQQAFAGGLAATLADVPWATSATTTAELCDPLQLVPKVAAWIDDQLVGLATDVGLDGAIDPRFSPELVLAYSTAALTGPVTARPGLTFVGPAVADRPRPPMGAWPVLDRHERNVLVSIGTVSSDIGRGFLARVIDAVADQPYGVVVVGPPPEGAVPANVVVRTSVPQLDLLGRVDAVVCHGGHNTVCEALRVGLPLVVAPIRDDQPIVADQVVRAGCGRRVSFARATPDELRSAIGDVLVDPTWRAAASAVQASFTRAGGAAAAADHLEALAGHIDLVAAEAAGRAGPSDALASPAAPVLGGVAGDRPRTARSDAVPTT